MVDLTRSVRFFLHRGGEGDRPARHNSYSAWPPARGLGRFYQLHVKCRGEVDAATGYFMNIKRIDEAVRDHAIAALQCALDASADETRVPMGALMAALIERIQPALHGSVCQLRLELSPFYSLAIGSRDMQCVLISQQFEFSAAHRLHVPHLSDEENRQMFGKCNNPSGHGHNYHLEVTVRAPIRPDGSILAVESLDEMVDLAVIQYLDHKHLNVDIAQFAQLNPSVENIAKVIHGMLADRIDELDVQLESVSVWETPKTRCTYRGASAPAEV